jgi:uncharacterized protein involved in exopolysaccharide biosynthesis
MNVMKEPLPAELAEETGPQLGILEVLTWVGEGKRLILRATLAALATATVVAFVWPVEYTARTTLLPPQQNQQGGAAAALAAIGNVSGLSLGGLTPKTPDELYVALLRSDTVMRGLDDKLKLRERYDVASFEQLRRELPKHVRITADKKSGVITVESDDEKADFAALLANEHASELVRLLGRLAVTEAQQRRVFFEKQLRDTKENLVKADLDMQKTQERSGMIVLDKQAEAILTNMARLRAGIVEREVQLRVLRTAATEQNPDVIRLNSELSGLRAELVRMESSAGAQGSVVDIPAGKIPEAAAAYIRARREVKFQETLLESMLRQYEIAKLDEAKEGPAVQQVDVALAPDRRSKPLRTLIIVGGLLLGLLGSAAYVVVRRYRALVEPDDTQRNAAWRDLLRAWRWK